MTPPAATAAARRAAPARRIAPATRPQRRISGPSRPVAVPRRAPARRGELPAGARLLAWVHALPDHRLLARLIGGRVWIVLIGGLLVGIVTMQLTLLRLNAGIGRAVERSSVLEQRNAALRTTVSRLSDSARIVERATQMGYVTPPQGSPRYLAAGAGDAGRALVTMRVPSQNPATTVVPAVDPTAASGTITDVTTTAPDTTTTAPVAATTPDTPTTAVPPAETTPTAATTAPAATTAAPSTTTVGAASAPTG